MCEYAWEWERAREKLYNVSMLTRNGKLTFVAFQRVFRARCLFNLYTEIVLFAFHAVVAVVVDTTAVNVAYAEDV